MNIISRLKPASARNVMRTLFVIVLGLALSGCFLRFALMRVVVTDLGELIEVSVDMVFNRVTAAVCLDDDFFGFSCTYGILTDDGSVELISSVDLISDFGLFGVLIDPVIVQVPANTTVERARVNDGTVIRDLVVTELTSFEAQPGTPVTAEAGQKFLIFELPEVLSAALPSVHPSAGPQFDFDVSFRWQQATHPGTVVPLKAMFAGRVEAGGEVFYAPLLPCVTNFGDVPPVDLFVGGTAGIFSLLFHYFDHRDLACDGQVYDYTGAGVGTEPLQCDTDIDRDVDRNDINAIIAARNTPATGPNDPMDPDRNGTINVLDARQCVLECTLPRCVVP